MKPITDQKEIERWRELIQPLVQGDSKAGEFAEAWIVQNGWKVVPVEDVGHFNPDQRSQISAALAKYGVTCCVAVAMEPLGEMPSCFELQPSEDDLDLFNQECGLFRYLLTDEKRSWAISCDIWYNLFAGPPELLAAMLGKPIEEARGEFFEYASVFKGAQPPDESILQIARHYSAL